MKMIQQRVKRWTEEENDFIKNNYLNMSDKEMSEHLEGRTEKAVKEERKKLKLFRPKTRGQIVNKSKHKITFKDVEEIFKEKEDYILLSTKEEYKNQASKIRYLCKKHLDKGELTITYGHLKEGKGCYYCGRERTAASRVSKVTNEEDRKLCETKGFEYVKTEKLDDGYYYIFFICNKHREFGVQKMRRGNMNREFVQGCQYCIGRNLPQWYIQREIESKYPNIRVVSDYLGMNKPLECYCLKHNKKFSHNAKQIFYYGTGCDECKSEKLAEYHRLDVNEVIKRVNKANPDIEIVDPYSYTSIHIPMEIKCKKCGHIWYSTINNITANEIKCPKCSDNIYKGEAKLMDILILYNIQFQPQYTIPECKNKRTLPFDNAILDNYKNLKGLIEYQGRQHYEPVDYFGGEENFKEQQKRDKIKYNYCKEHDIPLLLIPYWEFNNMENLVIEFVKKIN